MSSALLLVALLSPPASASDSGLPHGFRAQIIRRSQDLRASEPEIAQALQVLIDRKALRGVIYDWELYREREADQEPVRELDAKPTSAPSAPSDRSELVRTEVSWTRDPFAGMREEVVAILTSARGSNTAGYFLFRPKRVLRYQIVGRSIYRADVQVFDRKGHIYDLLVVEFDLQRTKVLGLQRMSAARRAALKLVEGAVYTSEVAVSAGGALVGAALRRASSSPPAVAE